MKLSRYLFAATFILFVMNSVAQTTQDTIIILHMNDTHSNLLPIGPRNENLVGSLGGAARVKTILDQERNQHANVLTLHAGDSFIGDLFFNATGGAGEIGVLLSMGIDAMSVGNHEFDLTPVTLKTALDNVFTIARFPLVSANLILDDPAVQDLKKYIQPYTMKLCGNIKIGIFGLLTPATNMLSMPSPAVVDTLVLETAAAMVDTLRAKGCDMIICLSHLGITIDQAVAVYVPGIHLIVGGHDHIKFDKPIPVENIIGDTTYIVQTDGFYLHLGKLTAVVQDKKMKIVDYAMMPIDSTIQEDQFLAAMIDELRGVVESNFGPVYSQQIGYAKETFDEVIADLTSDGQKDTPIGNLVTDAYREMFKTDIAIEAGGSTSQPLYQGPIVAADLFRVVGYGFNEYNYLGYRMATFTMTGAAIVQGLETGLEYCLSENNDEFLIQASGLTYQYNAHFPTGQRCTEILVNNQPIDPTKNYTIASGEFTPMFMGILGIPLSDLKVYNDSTEFQTVVAYVSQRDTITPIHRNGIVNPVIYGKLETHPTKFGLGQNYPNPFNPTTAIRYQLPAAGMVTLKIYDVIGREMATLIEEVQSAGVKEVRWNATNASSGIYFYKLQAGTFSALKKMMLLK